MQVACTAVLEATLRISILLWQLDNKLSTRWHVVKCYDRNLAHCRRGIAICRKNLRAYVHPTDIINIRHSWVLGVVTRP